MATKKHIIQQPSLRSDFPISLLDEEKHIILQSSLHGGFPISLLSVEYSAHTKCILPHQHTRIEIIIIDEGFLNISTDKKQFMVQAGDIVIINSGALHEGDTQNTSVKYRVIMFELSFFASDHQIKNVLEPIQKYSLVFVNLIQDAYVLELCNKIFDAANIQSESSLLLVTGLTYQLLHELMCTYTYSPKNLSRETSDFSRVLDFISENYCNDITTRSVSKIFGYNEAYFCRLFKTTIGLNFSTYIRNLRLQKAKELLKKTQHPISYIASEVGYDDPTYFTKCFRKHYGIPPVKYRQNKNTSIQVANKKD